MPSKKEVLDRLVDRTPPETELATIYGLPVAQFTSPVELRILALWALAEMNRVRVADDSTLEKIVDVRHAVEARRRRMFDRSPGWLQRLISGDRK